MGDIIEITVATPRPYLYYKVDNGTWFDVKANSNVQVGLAKDYNRECQYKIHLTNTGSISILNDSENRIKHKNNLRFTLAAEYTRFWIGWDLKQLWVGIGNSINMVITCSISEPLRYITFSTRDTLHPASVKLSVPPTSLTALQDFSEPNITAGTLQWISCDDQLPDDAVIGGHIDGESVYVVRARHRQSLTPGVFIPSRGLAFIPWGGSDNPTPDFEALCGFNLLWKPASGKRIPADAFVAGYSETNREPLFIGRAIHDADKIPGKVQLSHKACYIAADEKEIAFKNFEVLTVPGLNAACANEFIGQKTDVNQDHNDYGDNMSDYDGEEDPEID